MKIIAHRGLVDGPNKYTENTPLIIENALNLGFDVEIDVWFVNNNWFLGHDSPDCQISVDYLKKHSDRFWIHAKNISALERLVLIDELNCFWHQNDDVTLTSKKYLWTYSGKELTHKSICVMPEAYMNINDVKKLTCFGVCSDFANTIKKQYDGGD